MTDIFIPELEEEAERYSPREWSPEEMAIVLKYYNRVSITSLMKHLPNKTKIAIQNYASQNGLTRRRT